MHAGWCALAWPGEHTIYCFHMSDFPSSLLSYNRLCLCWGNLRGEGQKGIWKPSFESPFPPAASTLSLPFSPGSAGTVWPLPRLILGCFSELITLSPLFPLKSSVNYKNPAALHIWSRVDNGSSVSNESQTRFSTRLDPGRRLVEGLLSSSPP